MADEAVTAGLVNAISGATVRRWLRTDARKPWQYRSWVAPPAPDFAARAAVVLDLYAGSYNGQPLGQGDFVLCADEQTSIQARCRCHPTLPPGLARMMRVEHKYQRGGALAYLAAWDAHRGKVFGRCEPTTAIAPFARLVQQVMTIDPYASARRVFWVVDNGSSHRGQASIERMPRRGPPPPWSTPRPRQLVEPVRTLLLRGATQGRHPNDFSDLAEVENRLAAFQERYNLAARPFDWTYTTNDLTDLLDRLAAHDTGPLATPA